MKVKISKQTPVSLEPEIHERLLQFCRLHGLEMKHFASRLIEQGINASPVAQINKLAKDKL